LAGVGSGGGVGNALSDPVITVGTELAGIVTGTSTVCGTFLAGITIGGIAAVNP